MLQHELLLRRWAVEVLKDTFGTDSLKVDGLRDQLVVCLQRHGRVDQARLELRQMLLSRETCDGANSISVCDILMRLVDLERSQGREEVDESRRQVFALQRLQVSDWQATREEELHKLSGQLAALEKAYTQRLQQAVKLMQRSLSIKLAHHREVMVQRAADAYPHLDPAAALRISAVSGGAEEAHGGYPLEACPELQRLGMFPCAAHVSMSTPRCVLAAGSLRRLCHSHFWSRFSCAGVRRPGLRCLGGHQGSGAGARVGH
jgi:hypothetical protein